MDIDRYIFIILACAGFTFASTYYVAPTPQGTADCSSSADACDFQTALNNAQADGTDSVIYLLPGTYNISSTLTYTMPDGDGKLTILAQDPNNKPVLNGNNAVQILNINNDSNDDRDKDGGADITIQNVIFTSGNVSGNGGALFIKTGLANVNVENCEFTSNQGSNGGGVYIETFRGMITLSGNSFSNNSASSNGGGAYLSAGAGSTNLNGNTFSNNSSSWNGGGAFISGGGISSHTLQDNTFDTNSANTDGGGLYIRGAEITLTGNTFKNNTSSNSNGGGVYIPPDYSSTITFSNNIFMSNSGYMGGGIYIGRNYVSTVILTNNTLYNNTATTNGGGVYIFAMLDGITSRIYNNIIWGNMANGGGNDGDDLFINSDGDNNGTGATVELFNNNLGANSDLNTASSEDLVITVTDNYTHGSNITSDPMFVNAGGGDLHIQPASPCVDAGDNNAPALPSVDMDGEIRIIGGVVDIGADEYNPPNTSPVINTFNANPSSGYAPLTVTFSWDVSDADGDPLVCYLDIDNDGINDYTINDCANNNSQQHTYTSEGNYTAKLTVEDGRGGSDTGTVNIIVDPTPYFTLSVTKNGDGEGTVISNPSGIDCGNVCSAQFLYMTTVTLTVTPSSDSLFAGWGGDCASCGTNTSCDIDIDSDKNCTATINRNRPPVINSFSANPTSGVAPLTVNFVCEAYDQDNSIAQYRWDFNGDGNIEGYSNVNSISYTYQSPGNYTAKCIVVDDLGATSEASITISVTSPPSDEDGSGEDKTTRDKKPSSSTAETKKRGCLSQGGNPLIYLYTLIMFITLRILYRRLYYS